MTQSLIEAAEKLHRRSFVTCVSVTLCFGFLECGVKALKTLSVHD